ncbi:MerR family transcriptional regulator [Saccharomonospora sp. NPDC006951]
MHIGELAEQTGATKRALRYYEQEGLLSVRRKDNGYRDYDDDAVLTVHNIRQLLETGLSIAEIRELTGCLAKDLSHAPVCAEAIELYRQRLDSVTERLEALHDTKERLTAHLAHTAHG